MESIRQENPRRKPELNEIVSKLNVPQGAGCHARLRLPMYVNVKLLCRAEYLSLVKEPFSIRRWSYVLLFTVLWSLMWIVVAIGRMLDHVFFRGFRRQRVTAPVFIIAPPRSGTTLMQKLMSLDTERFVSNKLYHTIFPSVTYQRLIQFAVQMDQCLGGWVAKAVTYAEKKWFGAWDDMHRLRFDRPEEDDGFFVYTFVTEAIYLLFPHVTELWEAGFSDALPPRARQRLMRYYRSCLQRQLYAHGSDKTILVKATQFSGMLESLREAFPDARFITIVRHPYESVPSHVSVFYPAWQAHSPELQKDSPKSKAYALLAVRWYQHLFAFGQNIDADQFYRVDYRDLVGQQLQTVERIYQHFGWEITDEYREKLSAACEKERRFRSAHRYSLEEFGLSKEWIQQELGLMMDCFSLPR